jgi:hypothetical protein
MCVCQREGERRGGREKERNEKEREGKSGQVIVNIS